MEILILWAIVGVVLRLVGDARKNQAKQQRRSAAHRSANARPAQANAQPKPQSKAAASGKKPGLLDSFIEQLRELEEQERQRQQGLTQAQKPAVANTAKRQLNEEEQAEKFRQEKDERNRKRLEERKLREPEFDANYAKRDRGAFSVEALEERFQSPAQRMIVFSEILDKPKALRR